jgi:Clr5-like protein
MNVSTTSVLRWKNGNASHQAEAISPSVWEQHKDVISENYDKLTLTALIKYMEKERGFTAR